MEIRGTGSPERINLDTLARQRPTDESRLSAGSDTVRTSDKALMLSRNAAALQGQLAPREEILQKFAGIAEADLNLNDETIDQIFNKL